MAHGVLAYQYVEDPKSSGANGLAGLPAYLDLAAAAGLRAAVGRLVGARPEESQGCSDAQVVLPLVLLNLAGDTAVEDIELPEADEGFCEVVRRTETHGLPRQQRRALERRLRKPRFPAWAEHRALHRIRCRGSGCKEGLPIVVQAHRDIPSENR